MPETSFWRHRVPFIAFSTAPQSLLASLCSGQATIEIRSASNIATNVLADLTVNLSTASGLTYYSDSNCTVPITSLTVITGTSFANFYFLDTNAASVSIVASATGYASGGQTENFATNNFIWRGGGGNTAWSTGGNWSGGIAPGGGDVATFDNSCVSNCSPTINSAINIGGFRSNPGYAGTITQSNGFTISVGGYGWVQTSGTFLGSTAGDAMSIYTNYYLFGGSFRSTTGTFSMYHAGGAYGNIWYKVGAASTFTPGTAGTVSFDAGCSGTDLTLGPASYYNVTIMNSAGCAYVVIRDTTVTVSGNFTLGRPPYGSTFDGGTLLVGGNVQTTGPENWVGSATIRLTGNASGQTVASVTNGTLPGLELAAGANAVTITGALKIGANYTVTSVGAFSMAGASITFDGNCGGSTITPGTVTYNDILFQSQCHNYNIAGGTMTIAGNLSFANPGYSGTINSGTFNVAGNVTTSGPNGWSGSAIVRLVGNGSGQTINSVSAGSIPNLTFATGANSVSIAGTLGLANLVTSSVGSVSATGSTLKIRGPSVNVGTESYNNVNFGGGCTSITVTGTMKILGNMDLTDYCYGYLDSGTLAVSGNISSSWWGGGTAGITMNGTTQQIITLAASGASYPSGPTILNNSAGLLLGSNVVFNGGQTFTVSNGNISMAGYNLTLSNLSLGGRSVTRSAGVLTVGGSTVPGGTQSLYGGTINP